MLVRVEVYLVIEIFEQSVVVTKLIHVYIANGRQHNKRLDNEDKKACETQCSRG